MKKNNCNFIFIFLLLGIFLTLGGCNALCISPSASSNTTMSATEMQKTYAKIPVLENIQPKDIAQITIPATFTLTDPTDILDALRGMQSIRLNERSETGTPGITFIYELKNGAKLPIVFNNMQLSFGDGWYSYDDSANPTTTGTVKLVSGGKEYLPLVQKVNSGTYACVMSDGPGFEAAATHDEKMKENLNKLEAIPYSNDLKILVLPSEGTAQRNKPVFEVYDEQINVHPTDGDNPSFPSQSGSYYVVAGMMWGTNFRHETDEYIFKVNKK